MFVNLSFDSSVNSAPAGFVSTVNAVAQFFQTAFSDNVTINVSVGFGEVAGQTVTSLGESITQLGSYSYAAIRSAFLGDSKTADDSSAAASLGASSPSSGATYWEGSQTVVVHAIGSDGKPRGGKAPTAQAYVELTGYAPQSTAGVTASPRP